MFIKCFVFLRVT